MLRRCLLVLAAGLGITTLAPAQTPNIEFGKGEVTFRIGKEVAAVYHYSDAIHPNKPILWPVNAPGGIAVTRNPVGKYQPGESADHPHQASAWFTYGDIIPEGIELKRKIKGVEGVDFWSVNLNAGKIICQKVERDKTSGSPASITTHNEWRTADDQKVLDETRVITLYDLGKARLFVFNCSLQASVCPLTFGDTKEGAFGIRVSDKIRETSPGTGTMTNAEGKKKEKEVWGLRSSWVDYSGTVDGKEVGVAILDDPKNPYPACWHARGYGLLAANPFGRAGRAKFPGVAGNKELVKLAKGGQLRFRYGLLVHTGSATDANVAGAYQRFVELRGKE